MRPMLQFHCQHRYPSGFELDLEFRADETITAISGPSGSGKTTVLALIAGLLRPLRGTIRYGDKMFVDTQRRIFVSPEQRHVGFVFQDYLLFPHLTVEQNLNFGLRRRARQVGDFHKAVEILELKSLLARYPHALSGGQRQRVALGRAILAGPQLLLLDEPLSSLDSGLKLQVLEHIERVIADYQIPTLIVSHDEPLVARIATHTVYVEQGKRRE